MKIPDENTINDFEVDDDEEEYEEDDKSEYARPILDGDNEEYYGFGYDYDTLPLFVDGLEMEQFLQQMSNHPNYSQAYRRRQRKLFD